MVILEQAAKGFTKSEAENMVVSIDGEVFTYFDQGLTRFVFVNSDKTKVVKVEQDLNSGENKKEVSIYLNASDKSKMAHTELVGAYVVQEYVEPQKIAKREMSMGQILFSSKCRGEVGWRGDTLVCFDLDEYLKY